MRTGNSRAPYLPLALTFLAIALSYPLFTLMHMGLREYSTLRALGKACLQTYGSAWTGYFGTERWLICHAFLLLACVLWLCFRHKALWLLLACAALACGCFGAYSTQLYGMYLVYGLQPLP